MSFLVFIVIVGIIALLVAASCIKIVPQAYAIVCLLYTSDAADE